MKSLVIMLIAFFAVFLQPPQVEAKGFIPTEYITQDLPPNLAAVIFVLSFGVEKDYYSYSNRYSCSLLDEIHTTNSGNYLNEFTPTTKTNYGYSMAGWYSLGSKFYTNLSRKNKDFSAYGLVHRS